MEVTRESWPRRWLVMVAVWGFIAAVAVWHATVMRDYLGMLDRIGQPAAAQATPLSRLVPGNYSDAQTWTRFALASQESGAWQVRYTTIDNAPKGREVHWSSAFVQLVAGAGRLQHWITREPLPRATASALAWFNIPVLMACVIGLSAWAAARAGAGAGCLVALGIIGLHTFYEGFSPNYADHHGLLTAAVCGLVLGMVFMGAGWWRAREKGPSLLPESRRTARRAAVASALCGAVGLWISAASTILPIGIVGLAGLATVLLAGRWMQHEGGVFDPDNWRWWGRVGATASVALYLLEYAPHHLGMRLEVNHPLHALAWWGGSEIVALLASWRLGGAAARPRLAQIIAPLGAIALDPIAVAVGGTAVFAVSDPFVADLRHTVGEGMSFRAAAQAFGSGYARLYVFNFILIGVAAWALIALRRNRLLATFVTLVASAFLLLACWEIRWWVVVSGPTLCLILVLVANAVSERTLRIRWLAIAGCAALLLPMGAISEIRSLRASVERSSADPADLMQPIHRDIALALRATQPTGEIRLLASPDASNSIGYYGRFQTLGTLYWENVEGLKLAAAIHCAEDDEVARQLLRSRGVTHLAMISRGNYLAEYFRLFRPEARAEDLAKTFGHRLLIARQIPRWLQVIPYRVPANVGLADLTVLLLRVVPDLNDFDAAWNAATAKLLTDQLETGLREYQLAITSTPAGQQPGLYQSAGDFALNQNLDAAAIPLYRAALQYGFDPIVAAKIAWTLSTSPNPQVRNGREALAVLEPARRGATQPLLVSDALAAALAESGRFQEAIDVCNRTLALLREKGDTANTEVLQQRLDAYRSGSPWRR